MCGISGFAGKGSFDDLKRMNDTLALRGPDAEGFWYDSDKGVFLGHRRLSIIDLSGGVQPMWTIDEQYGIIFNGEIYNHLELRQQLIAKGHRFQTDHSDTEVLLHGYKEWGEKLPTKLNGMWAFVIYNKTANQLFCSRDRFGKKPFFYSLQNGTFAFASELTALTKHTSIQSEISERSLKKYFAYGYIPSPNTLLSNVYKLAGGNNLTLDLKTLKYNISNYWKFKIEPFESIPVNAEKVWGDELISLIDTATKRRLMSDVPLGMFLSGGIDSSAITVFANKYVANGKLKTFSIGFEEASFDETEYSSQMANLLKTEHYLEKLSLEKAQSLLPEIAQKLDEPMGDSSLLPTYLLCKITRKKVTVALGGDGADELFCGYDPFKALNKAELYNTFIPKPVHKGIRMAVAKMPTSHANMSLDFKLKRTLRGLSYPKPLWSSVWMGPLEPKELNELFKAETDIEDIYSEAIEQWESCDQKNIIDKTLQFYTNLYLQDDILVKLDRASMMNSLEVRSPFLDIEVADFARKIPHQFKFKNGQTKYLLKKALESYLPHNILYRPKKGFGVPIGKWFQEGKLSIFGNLKAFDLNENFICNYQKQHQNQQNDHRAFLWNRWLLSKWE